MKIRYPAPARHDLAKILEYYESRAGRDVAVEFFSQFLLCVERIAADPASFPVIREQVRRCLLNRFPYQINFQIVSSNEVKILVIKHQRRNPDFGLDR